jgi:hypothetical protein
MIGRKLKGDSNLNNVAKSHDDTTQSHDMNLNEKANRDTYMNTDDEMNRNDHSI